jgi:hypothetical protein
VVFRLGFAGSERRKQPRMSGIERDTEERGRARVSLPDGARMRARRRGRSRSPGGRGASTGGEAGRARRVGAEVLAGGVRLRGQGRQRGGERRLVGGWPPPAGTGGGDWILGPLDFWLGLGRVTATGCVMNSGRDDRGGCNPRIHRSSGSSGVRWRATRSRPAREGF